MEQLWRHFGSFVGPALVGGFAVLCLTALVLRLRDRRRPRPGYAPRVVLDSLLITWLFAVLLVTLYPKIGFTGERPVQLVPLASIRETLTSSVTIWVVVAQLGGNLALFVPFGLLARLRSGFGAGRVVAAGAVVVVAIELAQLASGTGRVASVDDVLIAVVGTALGWALARPFPHLSAMEEARAATGA